MTIQEVLLLAAISILLGILSRKIHRINLLMAASIALMYWLQPDTGLRYLGFWLPSITLVLITLSWVLVTSPEMRKMGETLRSLFLIFGVSFLISFLKFLDPDQVLGFVNIPRFVCSLTFLIAGISLVFLFSLLQKGSAAGLWVGFSIIIMIFVILKTPALAVTASRVWRLATGHSLQLANAEELVWLGYSYIAFRILHTIRDKQAGRLPELRLNEYVAYLVFYPSFVAGPIARVVQILPDLREIRTSLSEDLLEGSQRIFIGLFKKFVLADSLALFALSSQNVTQPNFPLGGWILLYAFSLQIYFDFSGYTDIAIGLARYLNFKLPENFNRPYLKPNLTQFWSNWHMTLTNWFRAYFFNPISRYLRKKKTPAIFILFITQVSTMVLVGLWHGITINFVIWGLWHGLGLLFQNRWSDWAKKHLPPPSEKGYQKIRNAVGVFLTFHYVTLGWIWFVLPSPETSWEFLALLFGGRL